MAQDRHVKPYVRLAYTLIAIGMGIFALERLGLGELSGMHIHLAGWLIATLVIAPVALVLAGCAIFMFGRMRRL
jgi:hypothetical protein